MKGMAVIIIMGLLFLSAGCQGGQGTARQGKSFYVSALKGSDVNPGTEDQPFQTLAKAVSVLQPGSVLYVMAGTYRETLSAPSGNLTGKIQIMAYQDEQPVISGAEEIFADWLPHEGQIYKTPLTGAAFNQLFVDGKMMTTARWPNAISDPDMVLDMERAKTTGGDANLVLDSNLPVGDWVGGKIYIWPGDGWISFVKEIKAYNPGQGLTVMSSFSNDDSYGTAKPYTPRADNDYFIFGRLAGLDVPNEWVIEDSYLYLYAPDGKSPKTHRVEYRARDFGIDLKGREYVEISGISLFAAAITMENANHCVIDRCHQKYHEHFEDTDGYAATFTHHLNHVSGSHNVWKNSEIAFAAGDGIRLDGSENVIDNMLIHDIDYSGAWFAGVMGQPGRNKNNVPDGGDTEPLIISSCNNVTVTRSTIFNCGRNAISHHKTGKFDITYNDLSHASKLVKDCGLTSAWGTDGQGSTIAFNWLHDNIGTYTAGVYLDNYCRNFNIHHNVIWNCSWAGIQLNSWSRNNNVYNNTILGCGNAFMNYTYPGDIPDQSGTRIFNNLFEDPRTYVYGKNGPWLSHNITQLARARIDARFVPLRGTALIDGGTIVPGIDISFHGKAPDVGAYEYGDTYWTPGSTLKELSMTLN
jgi:hypothetical protein